LWIRAAESARFDFERAARKTRYCCSSTTLHPAVLIPATGGLDIPERFSTYESAVAAENYKGR
jgi:hypothetical protein